MGAVGKKIVYLESLRGIAALVVVMTHFAAAFYPVIMGGPSEPLHTAGYEKWIYGTPLAVLFGGNFSVCLFFILSGFVLTYGFFGSGQTESLARGAMKRYARLAPPVIASVLLTWACLSLGLSSSRAAAHITGSAWLASLWHIVPNFGTAMYQGLYEALFVGASGTESYNPVLWTMQIEFMGSLLVFGMAALLRGYRERLWVYLALLAACWHNYYLGFIFGLMLADLVSQVELWERVRRAPWGVWLGLLLVGLSLGGYPSTGVNAGTMYSFLPAPMSHTPIDAVAIWHALGALLVVGSVLAWSRTWSWLMWRPLVWLGKQSFGLYLTHILVLGTFSSYLFVSLFMSSHGYTVSFLITFVVSMVLILLVSSIFTRWVDQPSIALARYVAAGGRLRPWRWRTRTVSKPTMESGRLRAPAADL